jgi:hypothetical protein
LIWVNPLWAFKAKNENINLINIVASGIDIAADQAIAGI